MGAKRKTTAPESGAAVKAEAVRPEAQPAAVMAEVLPPEEPAAEQPAGETAVPVHAAYADYEETPCVVRAGKGLNLRAGPGRDFPAAAVLPDGTPVNVLELPYGVEVPGWALVVAPAGFGWVMRDFLAEPAGED